MSTDAKPDHLAPVHVWGLPLAPMTFQQTLDEVDRLIAERKPGYFITANLHYAMLTSQEPRLGPINDKAAFVLADGMPLVWASRWHGRKLPERVTGSDLLPMLCERAAQKGHRIFFLGGAPGIAEEAAKKLCERYPGLQVAGIEVPPFREPTPEEHQQLIQTIRDSKADILFIAFGQPKGEIWMADNCEALGVPACVQIGGSFDFVVGKTRRAPKWMQKTGLEWFYRFYSDPKRLGSRYFHNGLFITKMLASDFFSIFRRKKEK